MSQAKKTSEVIIKEIVANAGYGAFVVVVIMKPAAVMREGQYLEQRYRPRVTGEEMDIFYYNGIKDWNALPDRLKAYSSLPSFKSTIKQHMQEVTINRSENQYIFYYTRII